MTWLVLRMIEDAGLRDVEGRPLREGRTPRELLGDGDIEYRPCPYPGSRHRHENPMNVSALRQMGRHWSAIVELFARCRALHDRARSGGVSDLMDVWRTSQLGSALPFYFVFRDGAVPAHAAALAKATLGVGIWAQRLLVRARSEPWEVPPLTAEVVCALAEETGTLIGDTEVCSGGDKMLHELFDVLVTGSPAPVPPAATDDAMIDFGAHYAGFKLVLWIAYLARRFLYADAGIANPEPDVQPSDFFIVEPSDLTAVTLEQRAGWFRSLAELVVPFAPGGRDLALRDHAFAIAAAMVVAGGPRATFARLDGVLAATIGHVEVAFRRATGQPASPEPIADAAVVDRVIGPAARAALGG
jgi:hypothetical protein